MRVRGNEEAGAWRLRDWVALAALLGWVALVVCLFPAPAPAPPAIPYSVARLH